MTWAAVRDYVAHRVEQLDELYDFNIRWPTPLEGATQSDRCIELRALLHESWITSDEATRIELASDYVRLFGGIQSNAPRTIASCVQTPAEDLVSRFAGISSWSKVLSISDPTVFAIYDSRVAFSLNAIQVRAGGRLERWPIPPGRNSLLRSAMPELKRRTEGAPTIRRKNCYSEYMDWVLSISADLDNCPVERIEMLLFASAETLAGELLQEQAVRHRSGTVPPAVLVQFARRSKAANPELVERAAEFICDASIELVDFDLRWEYAPRHRDWINVTGYSSLNRYARLHCALTPAAQRIHIHGAPPNRVPFRRVHTVETAVPDWAVLRRELEEAVKLPMA